MYTYRLFIMGLFCLYIISPLILEWAIDSRTNWYRPYVIGLIFILIISLILSKMEISDSDS